MTRILAKILSVTLVLALLSGCAGRAEPAQNAADFLLKQPLSGAADWTAFALARSGKITEKWEGEYLAALENQLTACGGVLSETKNTEYSRTALALHALGKDPGSFGGFDLLAPLRDVEKTAEQGAAGISYALLALGGGADLTLRERYIEKLLACQLPGGEFAPQDGEADVDLTAIALQALAQNRDIDFVEPAIAIAASALSTMQNPDGSFSNSGTPNAESTAQVIIALCTLGINGDSSRFIKEKSVFDAFLAFSRSDGGFAHTVGGKSDILATQQALCALAAMDRQAAGESRLYDFAESSANTCTFEIRCAELEELQKKLPENKRGLVPEGGIILRVEDADFSEGDSVFDIVRRELKAAGIHFEFTSTPLTDSIYIEGIANLYEFDAGDLSGWLYSVNGEYPAHSCSEQLLEPGDVVVFEFVCSKRAVTG